MVFARLRSLGYKAAIYTLLVTMAAAGGGLLGLVAKGVRPTAHAEQACLISDKLVNSCRPWLGAAANGYPGLTAGHENQIYAHEQRIGRQLDIVHLYHAAGTRPLSDEDKLFAKRANTILSVTWKPAEVWATAGGSDDSVNATIDAVADDFLAMGNTKIMLTLYHEPEDQVSGGATGCAEGFVYKGTSGTPAEYRAMWRNIHDRFAAKGVSNVVWVMNYMGFSNWDCMVDDLWPGNDLVDWVMWDPYADTATFTDAVGRFYGFLEQNSDAEHDYASKPWGLAEWGSWRNTTREHTYAFYDDAKTAVEQNRFPRLKAYDIFDSQGVTRIGYDKDGVFDQTEIDRYKAFANSSVFSGSAATDTQAPTAPANLTATYDPATRGVNLAWEASSDDVAVQGYKIYRDGIEVANSATTQYADSQLAPNSTYSYSVVAYDYAGHVSPASTATVFVPDSDAPSTVGNLQVNAQGTSAVISWNAATDNVGVAGYSISRDGLQIAQTTSLTYTDSGLADGRSYTYSVVAFDSAGNASTPVSATIAIADITAPAVPAGLNGSSDGTQVKLNWSAATDNVGVAAYRLYRNGMLIATTTATSYIDSAIVQGVSYSYRVSAVDAAGNASASSASVTISVPDITAPSKPQNFTWTAGLKKVTLNWKPATDNIAVTGYYLYRGTTLIATLPPTTLTYTDSGLVSKKNYTYKLQAFDAAGNVGLAAAVTATPN